MKSIFLSLGLVVTVNLQAATAPKYDFFTSTQLVEHKSFLSSIKVRVGLLKNPKAKANVIYLHGFADTIDNHQVLLTQLRDTGVNVIAFDYPGHGDSEGHIWAWSLGQVAQIIRSIMNDPNVKVDKSLPVILAGWSTGATMALRIMQQWDGTGRSWKRDVLPDHKVIGLVLFAPAVPANFTVGDEFIFPEIETLTRSKDAIRNPPKPSSTLAAAKFTASLKLESEIAASSGVSVDANLPMLVIAAGDNDMYTTSANTITFIQYQASKNRSIYGFQCTGAYHGLEFEPDGIGETSIRLATRFTSILANDPSRSRSSLAEFRNMDPRACPRVP